MPDSDEQTPKSTDRDRMKMLPTRIPDQMDERIEAVKHHYSSRSELVRNAIRHELIRLENKDAIELDDD
jgi:metal-responsive CopG/Arc/MetJ family transcriptional regulator